MKLAVPFEIRIFLVVVLVGIISVLVILDTPEPAQAPVMYVTSGVIQGLQQPGEPTNTLVITGIDIGQTIGYKSPSITGNEFACMADRKITTNAGRTTVRYTLLLRDPTVGGFNGCYIDFTKNEQDVQGLYMHCPSSEDMLAFIIEFDSGLRSEVKADGTLDDLEEKDLPMLGAMYTIFRAEANIDDNTVELRLMGPTGTIDMRDEYNDNDFSQDIQANGKNIMEGRVRIIAAYDGRELSISRIEYRFTPIAIASGDIYVADHHGTKQYLRSPEGFFGDFDILFRGLQGSPPKTVTPPKKASSDLETANTIKFDCSGNVKYNMKFTNNRGQYYKFPLVYDTGGALKWGDETKNFVFSAAPILPHDLFAVSNGNNKRSVTSIAEYVLINTDENKVYIRDLAGKEFAAPYDPATGTGTMTLSGNQYAFAVALAPPYPMAVDHDGNGAVGGQANLVTVGGIRVILNPAFTGVVYVEPSLFAEGGGPEILNFAFSPGVNVDITGGVQMFYNDATDMNEGLSGFGIFVQQTTKKDTCRDLTFNLPGAQLGAKVKIASPAPSIGGQAQGEVLVTCERSEFAKKAQAQK